jgi:hypothetical protein
MQDILVKDVAGLVPGAQVNSCGGKVKLASVSLHPLPHCHDCIVRTLPSERCLYCDPPQMALSPTITVELPQPPIVTLPTRFHLPPSTSTVSAIILDHRITTSTCSTALALLSFYSTTQPP